MRTIVTSYSEQQQRNLVEVQGGGYFTDNEGGESSVSIPNKAKEIMMHMQHQHQPQTQTQEVTTAFETAVVSPAISPISHTKSYKEQDQEEPRNNDDDDEDEDENDDLHRRNSSKINSTNNVNNLIDSDNNNNNYISDSSNTTINGEDSSNSQSLSQSISQSLSQFALSITQSQQRQQPQPQSPPLLLQDSSVAINLNDLYLSLKRREWDQVFEFLEKNPNLVASSQQTTVTSTTKAGGTSTSPLLHDVLRYNPPLSVVGL